MPSTDLVVTIHTRHIWYVRLVFKIASVFARLPGCRSLVIPITRLAWMQWRMSLPGRIPVTEWRWLQVRLEDERKASHG